MAADHKPGAPRRPPAIAVADLLAPYDCVALVLQGGGALGAYQAGVYHGLHEAGIEPTWLSGVSIGAINATLIAGNPPERRLERLTAFWERVAAQHVWPVAIDGDVFRALRNQLSAWMTMSFGQPGFFTPRPINPWLRLAGADGATSYYDSGPLRETLTALVDWDLANDPARRLSVGAVNVRTGNFRYFDSALERIGPEHVMASGALPPALPAVKIENEYYWDGGIVSNTPLQYLLELEGLRDTLVFEVDLFSARGELPRDMAAVTDRHKDILYSSRTRNNTDTFRRLHDVRMRLRQALRRIDPAARTAEDEALLAEMEDMPQINIVHLIYQRKSYEGHAKGHEFSADSMKEHWAAGLEDTRKTLRHRGWLEIPPESIGVTVHDVHRDDPS